MILIGDYYILDEKDKDELLDDFVESVFGPKPFKIAKKDNPYYLNEGQRYYEIHHIGDFSHFYNKEESFRSFVDNNENLSNKRLIIYRTSLLKHDIREFKWNIEVQEREEIETIEDLDEQFIMLVIEQKEKPEDPDSGQKWETTMLDSGLLEPDFDPMPTEERVSDIFPDFFD